jgi:hypothetical protein
VKESGGIILVQDPNEAGCGRCRGYQFDNGHAIGVDARAKSA